MSSSKNIRDVQMKILEIMKYIDQLCRANGIVYFIMGGTALGAVRHGGFIPWDDDLDIFMTPDQYEKFKSVLENDKSDRFFLQEWRTTPDYLEYAKLRMNGTTFIEKQFADRKDMHHGIFVDIMILHKVPQNRLIQRMVYYQSKYVTLYGLSQRNWVPKTKCQKAALIVLKMLPNRILVRCCYRSIYRYDKLEKGFSYCYWITKAGFSGGLFPMEYFSDPVDIPFEDTEFLASRQIKAYLSARYGDYMKLPPAESIVWDQHAMIWDVNQANWELHNN